ncbi:hypothetical protein [Paraburkholderia sp.]|uniref:hypothetical protein n=1 Tax=Paraburkholderia sp. TaxID=1926495 RepID=UPI003C7CC062
MQKVVLYMPVPGQRVSAVGQWVHCSPALISAGVSCADTPRRVCHCKPESGGHDHFIVHASAPDLQRDDAHAFKNFHRLLCERFDYVHDDKDWRRDQLSLIEHIARLAGPASAGGQQCRRPWTDLGEIDLISDERFTAWVVEWRDTDGKRGFEVLDDQNERNAVAGATGPGFEVICYSVLYEVGGSLKSVAHYVTDNSRFE